MFFGRVTTPHSRLYCLTISRPFAGVVFTQHYDICQPAFAYRLVSFNHSSWSLFTSPRSVYCGTRCLTDDLNSVTSLMGDNWYIAVLLNVGASYALFVPEIYSPSWYDIFTRAPHYFAIELVRSNSLIHVYPFALNHSVMGLRLLCIAKFGGISPTRKPMKRVWLNFTRGRLLNFVTFIVIIKFLNVTNILSTLVRV